jgi:hypothetical protein
MEAWTLEVVDGRGDWCQSIAKDSVLKGDAGALLSAAAAFHGGSSMTLSAPQPSNAS